MFVGHAVKNNGQQVFARFFLVFNQFAAKVIDGTQFKLSCVEIVQPQPIAHLQVELELVVHFFIASAVTGFEEFQTNQYIYRYDSVNFFL